MVILISKYVRGASLFFLLLTYMGCSSSIKSTYSEDDLVMKSDSLLALHPDNIELLTSIVNAKINLAKTKGEISIFREILKIDPNNKTAGYYINMDEGYKYHNKAAALIDTLGEPYYWIGKAYEKKDEMDFELPLESYDKSLTLFLTPDLKKKVELSKKSLLKRKKTYEDFWR